MCSALPFEIFLSPVHLTVVVVLDPWALSLLEKKKKRILFLEM